MGDRQRIAMSDSNQAIKVFVSYTHDSPAHSRRVLDLANALRQAGFDCDIDQYHANQDWPAWMEHSIECSKFVLVVCTPTYLRRWKNDEKPGVGLGAQWESLLTRQHLYLSPGKNDKFVPLIFEPHDMGQSMQAQPRRKRQFASVLLERQRRSTHFLTG